MDDYRVLLIPKSEVEEVWKYVKGFVEKSILDDSIIAEDLYQDCIAGARQLWIVIDSKYKIYCSLITRMHDYPRKRVLQLNYLSGVNFENYEVLMMEIVDGWARKRGASEIELVGRRGWEKRFKKYNFSHAYSISRKSI